jgi:hypothetical protein
MGGVKRVEADFLNDHPSKVKDFMAVVAGHVVLVGVVNQQANVDKIVAHARATDGVVTVKSLLQVMGQ